MRLNDLTVFEAFSSLLQEVSVQHRDLQPWPDRPDLPQAVRHFWSCIGISKLSARYAPKVSPEADACELERVFEDWFEYAITRDRWGLEHDDEPTPFRLLPAKPRRLATKARESSFSPMEYRSYLLLASETEPEPSVFVISDWTSKRELAKFSYWRWFCFELLYRGTSDHHGGMSLGPNLNRVPVLPELDVPLVRVGEGVYLLEELVGAPTWGNTVVFRNLGCYAKFVLARPEAEQGHFGAPCLPKIEFKRTKSFGLDPQADEAAPGFVRHVRTPLKSFMPATYSVVGQIAGRWVWLTGGGKKKGDSVFAACEPSDLQAVETALRASGAQIKGVKESKEVLMATTWLGNYL
jgi:hypothetical protein